MSLIYINKKNKEKYIVESLDVINTTNSVFVNGDGMVLYYLKGDNMVGRTKQYYVKNRGEFFEKFEQAPEPEK